MKRSVVSRLNWPGLTSFIHVDDLVTCLLKLAAAPPPPGEARTYLVATESGTLQDVARLLYRALDLPYHAVELPKGGWQMLRNARLLCRWGRHWMPAGWYNWLWRFNLVVNPVFHCDTHEVVEWFPDLNPRRMADCIREICTDAGFETRSLAERGQPCPPADAQWQAERADKAVRAPAR